MRYFDTSFLAPLIREEAATAAVEAFMHRQAVGSLAASTWTRVELAGAIARHVRMGSADRSSARRVLDEFDDTLERRFVIWRPDVEDYDRARACVLRFDSGLRSGDAMHLAIAANRDAELISLDRLLLRAARTLGIKASPGIA
jgi:predicted nucleic acid-binding protein